MSDINGVSSPHSVLSRIDYKHPREKAELVLESLISTLSDPGFFVRFAAALPLARILLLFLGDRPSPVVASQVLHLVAISINASVSFSRKFELVSGWSVLKTVLPYAWDPSVHEAAFDILLGRSGTSSRDREIVCPYIIPAIFAALQRGLNAVANHSCAEDDALGDADGETLSSAGRTFR